MARPRDRELDARILDAATRLLLERPYEEFTIDLVAKYSGASRPSVYRRYPTTAHLAFEASMRQVLAYPPPDTGDFRRDLVEATEALIFMFRAMNRRMMSDWLATMLNDARFSAEVDRRFLQPGLTHISVLWERARERGEVRDDVDPKQWFEHLTGVAMYEVFVLHRDLAHDDVEQLVAIQLEGVLSPTS